MPANVKTMKTLIGVEEDLRESRHIVAKIIASLENTKGKSPNRVHRKIHKLSIAKIYLTNGIKIDKYIRLVCSEFVQFVAIRKKYRSKDSRPSHEFDPRHPYTGNALTHEDKLIQELHKQNLLHLYDPPAKNLSIGASSRRAKIRKQLKDILSSRAESAPLCSAENDPSRSSEKNTSLRKILSKDDENNENAQSNLQAKFGDLSIQKNTGNIEKVISKVYGTIRSKTKGMGNSYAGAINGELTMMALARVLNKIPDLGQNSFVIDIGSGVGKVVAHLAARYPGLVSIGVEMHPLRYLLSMISLLANLDNPDTRDAAARCMYMMGDVSKVVQSLHGITHVYLFDCGFPAKLYHCIARLFNQSSAMYLVSYADKKMFNKFGFDVRLLKEVPNCAMHGSGEQKTAKIYIRKGTAPQIKGQHITGLVRDARNIIAGGGDVVRRHVAEVVSEFHNSERSSRSSASDYVIDQFE